MFYQCMDCGHIFSRESALKLAERNKHGDYTEVKHYDACPNCRSGDLDDAGECIVCHIPTRREITICESCEHRVSVMRSLLKTLFPDVRPIDLDTLISKLFDE